MSDDGYERRYGNANANGNRNGNHENEDDLEEPLLPEEGSSLQLQFQLPSSPTPPRAATRTESATSSNSNNDNADDTTVPSLSRLILLGKPEFCILALAGILMIFSQGAQLYIPLLIGKAYDDLVDNNNDNATDMAAEAADDTDTATTDTTMASINTLMFWALATHVSAACASGLRSTLMGIAGERVVARMRTTLYSSILRQEIAFFDATQSGELVSRLGSDTMLVKRAIASSWAEVVLGFLRLVATLALMFVISPKLAGWTIGSTFTVFVACLPFGKTMGKLSKAYQETLGEAQNFPTEVIGAMRTVKSFGAEEREAHRYQQKIGVPSYCPDRNSDTTFRIGYDQSVVRALFGFCIFGGGFGAMYGTLWYGFALVHQNELKIGDLSAFQAYILGIGGILAHMSSSISNLIEARHASQRIFALLDREPKINSIDSSNDPSQSENGDDCGGLSSSTSSRSISEEKPDEAKISFDQVSFSYPTRPNVPVLHNFSLEIPRNKTTAIVGPSGAGKSTIVSLLERFYDVEQGSIRFDGVDIRRLDVRRLRRQLGYVQQEPTLFGLSVRDNLCYGLDHAYASAIGDEELLEACRTANAYDFVSKLPRGLDEMVGERGVMLSGGQKQRLAIARAILGSPSVLLLDEATSALDAESEFLVQRAMDAASKGRTVVVVAHRLSTIKRADQIVVMENHKIRDAGTHGELMNRCSVYQNLVSRQSFVATTTTEDDSPTTASRTIRGAASGESRKKNTKPSSSDNRQTKNNRLIQKSPIGSSKTTMRREGRPKLTPKPKPKPNKIDQPAAAKTTTTNRSTMTTFPPISPKRPERKTTKPSSSYNRQTKNNRPIQKSPVARSKAAAKRQEERP
jgi:ABC-type multidrug transport system fused ATPase/permease subunit